MRLIPHAKKKLSHVARFWFSLLKNFWIPAPTSSSSHLSLRYRSWIFCMKSTSLLSSELRSMELRRSALAWLLMRPQSWGTWKKRRTTRPCQTISTERTSSAMIFSIAAGFLSLRYGSYSQNMRSSTRIAVCRSSLHSSSSGVSGVLGRPPTEAPGGPGGGPSGGPTAASKPAPAPGPPSAAPGMPPRSSPASARAFIMGSSTCEVSTSKWTMPTIFLYRSSSSSKLRPSRSAWKIFTTVILSWSSSSSTWSFLERWRIIRFMISKRSVLRLR
mmetsp:Transcript_12182/g.28556  ORF Transcript_12182/g.28556 Transcript_12182/m.28556 type:complete len:273 (+) Transcript_12182:386-1204(+)